MKDIVIEKDGRPTECLFNERRELTACWPLEDALEAPHGRGVRSRGLILNSMMRRGKNGYGFSRHSVSLVSGAAKAEITFCPFCGTPMSEGAEEAVAALSEAQL